ncbi:RNA recognition motif-containing protein, partial [Serendipita sp. 405]
MPGKRKRDEEEPYSQTVEGDSHHHGTTVFVSNLPYTATSTDLKTLFSDVAPVKNAFVVLEKESKVSKGVGYVTFAMQEDAQACVERQTIDMNGRALRIGWAGLKPKPGESSPLKT